MIFNEQYSESVSSTCFISWPRTRNVIATQKWHTREKGRISHSLTNGNMVKLTLISIDYLHLFTFIYFPLTLLYLQWPAFWLLAHLITFDYNMFYARLGNILEVYVISYLSHNRFCKEGHSYIVNEILPSTFSTILEETSDCFLDGFRLSIPFSKLFVDWTSCLCNSLFVIVLLSVPTPHMCLSFIWQLIK